jgi:hypothetical protein
MTREDRCSILSADWMAAAHSVGTRIVDSSTVVQREGWSPRIDECLRVVPGLADRQVVPDREHPAL